MLLDNIYVINLDKSTDRLKHIKQNFNDHHIKFKRFSAIEGKKINDNILNDETTIACRTIFCNYGIIGCAMSHIALWKQLINDTTDYYIILEDDSIIDDNFINTINEINSIKNKLNFDILSLYCGPNLNCIQYEYVHELSNGNIIGRPLYPLSMASYIINKNGAKKILSLLDKINYHIDFEVAWKSLFYDINYFSLNNNIIKHKWDTKSTIETYNHKSILLFILEKLGFHEIYWILNLSAFTLFMKYTINIYLLLIIIILILNMIWFKNTFLYVFTMLEIILYFC